MTWLAMALVSSSSPSSFCRAWVHSPAGSPSFGMAAKSITGRAAFASSSSSLRLQKGWLSDDGGVEDSSNGKPPKLSAKKVTKREMMQQMKRLQKRAADPSQSTPTPAEESTETMDAKETERLAEEIPAVVVEADTSRNTTSAETAAAVAAPASPPKKRKKHKTSQYKSYEPNDNRDALPFAVQEVTPDPYTKVAMKKQRRKQQQTNPKNHSKGKTAPSKKKSQELEDPAELMTSRLKLFPGSSTDDNPNAATLLGEFALDQSTTSGDIICLETTADSEEAEAATSLPRPKYYKVEKARCQYKYAGGKKFVMVRKILEVKEITRALQEAQLEEQFQASSAGGIRPEEA